MTAPFIEQAIASGQVRVRRFERGDSGDFGNIQTFIAQRGYQMHCYGRSYYFKHQSQRGKPKSMNWESVLTEVDSIHMAEGLEPLRAGRAIRIVGA